MLVSEHTTKRKVEPPLVIFTYLCLMNSLRLLRLHKLHRLTGRLPVNEKYCAVIQFFEDFFDGLIIEPFLEAHPTDLVYHKNGIRYMRQDSTNVLLWCERPNYWLFFYDEIGLNYDNTQLVIQTMVSEHTNREVETPESASFTKVNGVSEQTLSAW